MGIIDDCMNVMDKDVARQLGWLAYSNGGGRWETGGGSSVPSELMEALSEGLRGTEAGLRAVALRIQRQSAASLAREATSAADKRLHAARVERQAAVLRARTAGMSQTTIDELLS